MRLSIKTRILEKFIYEKTEISYKHKLNSKQCVIVSNSNLLSTVFHRVRDYEQYQQIIKFFTSFTQLCSGKTALSVYSSRSGFNEIWLSTGIIDYQERKEFIISKLNTQQRHKL